MLQTVYTQRLIFDYQRAMHGGRRHVVRRGVRDQDPARIDGSKIHRLLDVLVEIAGLEPAASGLQSRRSPS